MSLLLCVSEDDEEREEQGNSSAVAGRGTGFCHSAISLGEFEQLYFREQSADSGSAPVRRPRVRSSGSSEGSLKGQFRAVSRPLLSKSKHVMSRCGQHWRVLLIVACFLAGVLCAGWENDKGDRTRVLAVSGVIV